MYHIIVNPASKSGRGRVIWGELEQIFRKEGIPHKVLYSKGVGHVTKVVERLTAPDKEGTDRLPVKLIILGGDGTINEALQGIRDFDKVLLGYIPTGSSNDLARSLQLASSPDELIRRIKKPAARVTDTGMLVTKTRVSRRFCVSCGIGLDAAVCKEALDSKLKNTLNRLGLGKLTYAGIALKQLISAPVCNCDITFEDGSTEHFAKLLFAVSMVHPYEGGGIRMAPLADCHDGLFDVMIVAGLKKWRALYLLPLAFFGLHTKARNVYFYKVRKLVIETDVPLIVHADGEYCGKQQKIALTCQKNGLKFI